MGKLPPLSQIKFSDVTTSNCSHHSCADLFAACLELLNAVNRIVEFVSLK